MAGKGPAPNRSRQRGSAPARGDWTTLGPLSAPILPPLIEIDPDVAWPYVSTRLWEAWRRDPVTATWNESDIAFAIDTIFIHAADGTRKANEVRLRMESLGLTPKGRRDLRFILPDEELPEEELATPPTKRPKMRAN